MHFITFIFALLLSSFVHSLPISRRHISESVLLLSDPFSAERIMSNSPEAVLVERAALARNHTPRVHRRALNLGGIWGIKKERELKSDSETAKRQEKEKEDMEKREPKTDIVAEKKDVVSNDPPADKRDESKQVEVEKKGDETQAHEVEKKNLPENSEVEERNVDPTPANKRMVNIPIQPNGPRRLEQEHGDAREEN